MSRAHNVASLRCVLLAVIAVAVLAAPTEAATAPAHTSAPADTVRPADANTAAVQHNLAALAVLHSYGYTVNTSARATRAIRHWQRANGLPVSGQFDAATFASLDTTSSAGATVSAPAVRDNLPPGSTVEQVVRFVWPDPLEDKAVRIAFRESRFVPTARNACCWGLFQINWSAHRGWLADIGVENPAQLLDAATNARAALALFERDGWQPWNP